MPHILKNKTLINFNPEFQASSAILRVTPYEPKVLIIGTYNESRITGNKADFFYGRNYFWPVFYNLKQNDNLLTERRILNSRVNMIPSLNEILHLCSDFKLTFADLITDVNVTLTNHSDKNLDDAVGKGQVTKNVKNILEYVKEKESITHIYATSKFRQYKHLRSLWESVKVGVSSDIICGSILTPSGQGGIPNFIGVKRAATIARYWLWVNHNKSRYGNLKNQDGYIHLDHSWLIQSGVDVKSF